MTDRPHSFSVESSDNRGLARALVGDPAVNGVDLDGGRLTVRTDDFERFTLQAPRLAREAGVTITEHAPLDESLESVFAYLVQR
jgi:ABC-2 type transport system ATP-binding protein